MGFLLRFAVVDFLLGDMMPKKYQNYYNQILETKEFPFDLRTANNPNKISGSVRHFIKVKNLPLKVKIRGERITINKKG